MLSQAIEDFSNPATGRMNLKELYKYFYTNSNILNTIQRTDPNFVLEKVEKMYFISLKFK